MVCATAELFSDHVTLYNDDLPSPRSFNAELDRWIHRWSVVDPAERLKTILLALKECPPEYYPNIRALLDMFVVQYYLSALQNASARFRPLNSKHHFAR